MPLLSCLGEFNSKDNNQTAEDFVHSIPAELIENEEYGKIFEYCKKFKPPPKEKTPAFVISKANSVGQRKTWTNQGANQVVEPLYYFKPTKLSETNSDSTDAISGENDDIVSILKKALATGDTVKAAGSGHSYSNVASTYDYFIDTHDLKKVANKKTPIEGQLTQEDLRVDLKLADSVISWPKDGKGPESHRALFETEAGITIRDLNKAMFERNVALINMGGYDGQTIVGAISTSTHGSGVSLAPFPDMVRSLVLATTGKWNGKTWGGAQSDDEDVYLYRIEPTDGITDGRKYKHPFIVLIQDNHCFQSVVCSMGCMGVIYSVVLEVMEVYWLEEHRYLTTLDEVIKMLSSPEGKPGTMPTAMEEIRNLEMIVHPYPINADGKILHMDFSEKPEVYYKYFRCLVSKRKIVPRPDNPHGKKGGRNFFTQLFSQFKLTFELIVALLNAIPKAIPWAIDSALDGMEDKGYINRSYEIYNLGLNQDAGVATEIGFPIQTENGEYTNEFFKNAIDKIHRIGQNSRINGQQYQTSPFAVRFVKSSEAKLSMMHQVNTCMIEMDMITGTYGGSEVMKRYQNAMYKMRGRPHWGLQFDNIPPELIPTMYPQFAQWMHAYKQFNRHGTFSSPFTDAAGITHFEF